MTKKHIIQENKQPEAKNFALGWKQSQEIIKSISTCARMEKNA